MGELIKGTCLGLFSDRIAIDLGTTYSVIAGRSSAEFRRIASSVAVERRTQRPIAFGDEAKRMMGRCPEGIEVVRPLRDGVITDFQVTNQYLSHLVKLMGRSFFHLTHDVYLCVPWGATSVEVRGYIQGLQKGRRHVYLVREPFASALGCEHDIFSPEPMTIIDMGGGTTEIATLADGYMLHATSIRAAGTACDQLVVDGFRQAFEFEVGSLAAEEAKVFHGSVWNLGGDYSFEIKGLERRSQLPKLISVSTADLRSFLEPFALKVESALYEHFNSLPSEALFSLKEKGVLLTGGTSMLKGWPERIEKRFGIPAKLAPDPLYSIIRGLRTIIQRPSAYRGVIRVSMEVFR